MSTGLWIVGIVLLTFVVWVFTSCYFDYIVWLDKVERNLREDPDAVDAFARKMGLPRMNNVIIDNWTGRIISNTPESIYDWRLRVAKVMYKDVT